MIKIEKLSPMLRMSDAEMDRHIEYGLNIHKHKRVFRERIRRRDECQYPFYADD